MAPSIVDVKDAEPVKKSSHGKVVENNIVHAAEFHRGKDGVLRQICGSWISSTRKPTQVYLVPTKRVEFLEYLTHYVRKTYGVPHINVQQRRWIHKQCKSETTRCMSQEEPQSDDIIPNFRTPPRTILIGSVLIHIST